MHEVQKSLEPAQMVQTGEDLVPLVGMLLPDLERWAAERGWPSYRARQIHQGLYRRLASAPAALTDLPLAVRAQLAREMTFSQLTVVREVQDTYSDTTKTLFSLRDGALVESVLMGYVGQNGHQRYTVCLSSQVGCALGCTFCATGLQGWARNLSAGEMVEQVLYFARLLQRAGKHITNVVYMGMGEPFLNYDAVWQSVQVFTEPAGFGLGARHITLSTSGVVPGIRRLTEEGLQVGLAVSLHAAEDVLRSRLVPLNRRYAIAALMDACRDYVARTNRRISFEYTMLAGINDGPEQASDLAELLRGLLCHVNLIPYNYVDGLAYQPSSAAAIVAFRDLLEGYGVPVTIRDTRGSRISAACGQLRTATLRPQRGTLLPVVGAQETREATATLD